MKQDIIIPHYKEPWETGKKFFDMLALQRGVNWNDIQVTQVQDGPEGELPRSVFNAYPYQVKRMTTAHNGVSAARNYGMDFSTADWVTFCDFDDMYLSALSLKTALDAIQEAEANGQVYIWNRFLEEGKSENEYKVFHHAWDMTFVHGRFIKRQFLIDNYISFNTSLSYGEDSDFNTICQVIAGEKRIQEQTEPIYLWCQNEDSVTRRVQDKTEFYEKMLKHRFATIEELKRRGIKKEYEGGVIRTVLDCYYEFTTKYATDNVLKCRDMFKAWYAKHKDVFMNAPPYLVAQIMANVREGAVKSGICTVETISLPEWLKGMKE